MSEVTQSIRSVTTSRQPMQHGFGDDGNGCKLFIINPEADPTGITNFCDMAEGQLDELLNEGIKHGGINSDRTWLVEMLVHATRAASESLHYKI